MALLLSPLSVAKHKHIIRNLPPETLFYFIVFYHIRHLCIFIPFVSMKFYHVTITFSAVVEQHDLPTISSFVFLHSLFIGT